MILSTAKAKEWFSSPLFVALALTAVLLALVLARNYSQPAPRPEFPQMTADNLAYLKIAQGHPEEVMSIYCRRALYPFMARTLTLASGLSFRASFIFLELFSGVMLVYFLSRIFNLFGLSAWLVAFFVLTPFTLEGMVNGYMPDLFHAAWIALFFFLVLHEKFVFALVILAIAYMARESTLIICLVFGVVAWRRNLQGIAAGAFLVILFGTVFGSWVGRLGLPNIHHLPDFLYYGLKVPHQFLKNVLGLRIWTNSLPVGNPIQIFTLPHFLRAGGVNAVALCYPDWRFPLSTLITLLTLFGTGPLIIRTAKSLGLWTRQHSIGIQVAFFYGLITFFLGTSIGDWVDRLVGYGWPLFWIVVPYVLSRWKNRRDSSVKWALFFLLLTAWLPSILNYDRNASFLVALTTLVSVLTAYVINARLFQKYGASEKIELTS
jgi:hypothetical protein